MIKGSFSQMTARKRGRIRAQKDRIVHGQKWQATIRLPKNGGLQVYVQVFFDEYELWCIRSVYFVTCRCQIENL